MANKSTKLKKLFTNNDIVSKALTGKSPSIIAEEVGLTEAQIQNILNKAYDDARDHYMKDAQGLLAKKYMLVETLITKLMDSFMKSAEGENGKEIIDLAIVDRIDKLIATQMRLIASGQTGRIQTDDEIGNAKIYIDKVFSINSPEYERIRELAAGDPNYGLKDEPTLEEDAEKYRVIDGEITEDDLEF